MSTVQYRVRRADDRYAYVSGSLIVQRSQDGSAERVIGSIRDVTSEHLLEDRLRQAQKMEAVGQLAGGVAHDFNNLLTVIGGHVFMLEQASADNSANPGEPDPRAAKHLAGITRATDRAASLTRQLLAFGRKQLLSPTLLDVNAVVEETLHMMRPAWASAPDHHAPRPEPARGLRRRRATGSGSGESRAQRARRDAADERWNAHDRDGERETDDRSEPRSGDAISAVEGGLSAGEYVRLTMRDNGTGMDAETLSRAFEPFFTTKPHGRGTGLGLAIGVRHREAVVR